MKWFRSIMNIKQVKSWRSIFILLCGTTLGILLDLIVITTDKVLIPVKADYLNEVFGAVCGVAVLGNAMLSMLFDSSEKVIKGVPFQDVLRWSKFGSDQQLTIVATLCSILIAVVAYAYKLYTTLTFLLCLDASLILAASLSLWNIFSDDTKQAEVVNEIIMDENNTQCSAYAQNWFDELKKSLETGNENTVKEYCCMLEKISATKSEVDHPINKAISHHLPIFFEAACEKIGFVDAYKLFKSINHIRPDGFVDCEDVALRYISSLKYFNKINTHNRNIPKTIESIIEKMEASDWEKISFVYEYFCAVFKNPYLDEKTKSDLLVSILNELSRLRDSEEGELKKRILLEIVKNHVILNADDDRAILFQLLTESLLRKNRYAEDSVFVGTIAEIFRAFFFYIHLEVDTLTKEYRDGLMNLYQIRKMQKETVPLSFSYLVWEYREGIISWLAEDAVVFDRRRALFWDYYSPVLGFKRLVWTSSETIRFAFCFYKLIGYTHREHPFISILDSDKYTDPEKMAICREITNLYSNGQLNSEAIRLIDLLEELTGIRGCRDNGRNKPEHDYFQERLAELETANRQAALIQQPPTDDQMLKLVNQILQKGNVFELNTDLRLKPATRTRIEPSLVEINKHRAEHSAQSIARLIQRIINDVISRKLKKVSIDFGQEGVQTLLGTLGCGTWEYRNYTHVNDYAIPSAVRQTDEFKRLCEILSQIEFDPSREISPYVFLKKKKISYNVKLRYQLSEANEESCAKYVRQHQVAEGVYQIGLNRFDYSHAIRYVRKNYQLETVDVFVRVDINADSGLLIEFKRK